MAIDTAVIGVCAMNSLLSYADIATGNNVDERLRQLFQKLPLHGGDVEAAAARYGIPLADWIDLSTGMNPQSYPIPEIPIQAFRELPYWRPEFLQAAEKYYAQSTFVPVSGSQQAIQALPNVLIEVGHCDVLLPAVGYQEHARQWDNSGANLAYYASLSQHDMCKDIDARLATNSAQHLIVIRPNNPTAVEVPNERLCSWAETLSKGSYLIVDEAFIDIGHQSLLTMDVVPSNVIVMRSFGKFFGLAGIRLGFVFANERIVGKLTDIVGIWQINGPAQAIATVAMNDMGWQKNARQRITINSALMKQLLDPLKRHLNLKESVSASLFSSYEMDIDLALALNDVLSKLGLLTRVIILGSNRAFLRFGCISADNDEERARISQAVEILCTLNTVAAMLDYQVDVS